MKSELGQLTMEQFIKMLEGDYSVLIDEDKDNNEELLKKAASSLIFKYKEVTSPSEILSYISDQEKKIKIRGKIVLFQIFKNLFLIDGHNDVRDILKGIYGEKKRTDDELEIYVDSMLTRSIGELRRLEEKESDDDSSHISVRDSFYKEVAFIMTFYKMNIDIKIINAAVYANIVNQAMQEIKTKTSLYK